MRNYTIYIITDVSECDRFRYDNIRVAAAENLHFRR